MLSTFFWMLTLWAYSELRAQPERCGATPCCWPHIAAALLSKPMAVTLPFVLLLLDVWPLGRWGGGGTKALAAPPW